MSTSFSSRDLTRLAGVHPTLVGHLQDVFDEMLAAGHPMFVVMGVRTVEQQQALFAQGRTAPGHVVTMKDGVRFPSNHQPHADDHLGHAVDCAFADVTDPFAATLPWESYGVKLEARGLVWGGRWTHPHDCPHAELPASTGSLHPPLA